MIEAFIKLSQSNKIYQMEQKNHSIIVSLTNSLLVVVINGLLTQTSISIYISHFREDDKIHNQIVSLAFIAKLNTG